MSRYLDPKADVVFNKIFGDHPKLLVSFLNAVLPLAADAPIVGLVYLPMEQVPAIPGFRRTIVNVKCEDAQGRAFIVEMQMDSTDSFFKQELLFESSQAIVKQLECGEELHLIQPVYGLGLVASIYEKTMPEWYHYYQRVRRGVGHGNIIEHLQLMFIELPKFPVHSPEEKRLRLLWLRFLREIDEKTVAVAPELLEVPEIAEAVSLAEESAYTPGELAIYSSYWDQVRREKTLIRDKYVEGLAEGRAAGLVESELLGIKEGLQRGIKQVALNMLRANKPVEEISLFTGLSREAIVELRLHDH